MIVLQILKMIEAVGFLAKDIAELLANL